MITVVNAEFYGAVKGEAGAVAQRCRVRKIDLTTSGLGVTADAGAFALNGVLAGGTVAVAPSVFVAAADVGGVTVFTLSFPASEDGVEFHSLKDGRYTLHVDGSKLHDAGGVGADADFSFHVFYGDRNADGQVDAVDRAEFDKAVRSRKGFPAYRDYWDYDQNTLIDSGEYQQFLARMGKKLNADATVSPI